MATIALAWFGVARGLRPLEDLRTRAAAALAARPAADSDAAAPVEIAPVVEAFNALLEPGARRKHDAAAVPRQRGAPAAHAARRAADAPRAAAAARARRRTCAARSSACTAPPCARAASRTSCSRWPRPRARRSTGRELERRRPAAVADAAARDWAPQAHAQKIDLGFALETARDARRSAAAAGARRQSASTTRCATRRPAAPSRSAPGCDDGVPVSSASRTPGPAFPTAERGKVLERFYRIARHARRRLGARASRSCRKSSTGIAVSSTSTCRPDTPAPASAFAFPRPSRSPRRRFDGPDGGITSPAAPAADARRCNRTIVGWTCRCL